MTTNFPVISNKAWHAFSDIHQITIGWVQPINWEFVASQPALPMRGQVETKLDIKIPALMRLFYHNPNRGLTEA